MESYIKHFLCISLLLIIMFLRSIHFVVYINSFFSYLLLDNITIYKYTIVCLSITFVGQLSCFQFGAVMNNPVINIQVQVFLWKYIFYFSWVSTQQQNSQITREFYVQFYKKLSKFLSSSFSFLNIFHYHQQYMRVSGAQCPQ